MLPITDKEFDRLSDFIKSHYGIHLKREKKTLMIGRLHKVLIARGVSDFTAYYEKLIKDETGRMVGELVDRISTNHTFFMRESDHFDFFKTAVLPPLKEGLKHRDLRVWCAASSTGEEPYTLAMIIKDVFENEAGSWDTKLLATDISTSALETAKAGIYELERIAPLPSIWKKRYFKSVDKSKVVVTDDIKRNVLFRKLNLMDHPYPFKKKLHVIFCRNVMIYFDQHTKDQLIKAFYNALEDGGYLFIGHSESINRTNNPFKYIRPSVYQKPMHMRR